MPEISIIVPVYNVETYLRKCIDSILTQTFTDFELILVDDGSPDRCGEICEEYANRDSRVVVIHKENGGLSSARNAGLDAARGEYIGFVDSDDYIKEDMYATLYNHLVSNNADISICGISHCFNNQTAPSNKQFFDKLTDSISALKLILEGESISVNAVNKLYKRSIFDNLRYPLGKTSEDAYVIVEVMLKASIVHIDTSPKYYYVHRENSITTREFSEKNLYVVEAYRRNVELVRERCPEILASAYYRLCWSYTITINKMIAAPNNVIQRYKNFIKEAKAVIRKNLLIILKQSGISRKVKIICIFISMNPNLYILFKKCYNKLRTEGKLI